MNYILQSKKRRIVEIGWSDIELFVDLSRTHIPNAWLRYEVFSWIGKDQLGASRASNEKKIGHPVESSVTNKKTFK